jgi:hypothetical protein
MIRQVISQYTTCKHEKSQGAHIPENSETALKPDIEMKTTKVPTRITITTNQIFEGYQFNCVIISKANRTALAETVIIAAEITVKIKTLSQSYNLDIWPPAFF